VINEYSFGLPPVPLTNVPMRQGMDPHGALSGVPAAINQASHFMLTGEVKSFCANGPCTPN
jgi:hypothetical protein